MQQLKLDEGVRSKPYDDATGKELRPGDTLKGNLTIGIGRNLTGVGLSSQEIFTLNDNDIDAVENEILHSSIADLYQKLDIVRAAALVNMVFNMGLDTFLKFEVFIALLRQGSFSQAANDLAATAWAKQVGPRAVRLEAQIRTGQWQLS